ncbi:SEC14 domain and spectrin repeat-containing protein 1-B [Nilaparvata lugens]|uniref:SEC14 domain and spectrin repeat-containing protein 1-B n=1 Tax=Nilaparvata lugens TaxID=108931 RepID=UPI00193C9A95|nr:SEC14 domain and spectrin repeat-containing protein 1-B [Nilaparvata lugens]
MESPGVMEAVQSRAAVMPGGRDREERPLIIVPVPMESSLSNSNGTVLICTTDKLETCLKYYMSILSAESRRQGVVVVVDGQHSSWRMVRVTTRHLALVLGHSLMSLIVLRPDAFWDKQRMDACARLHREREPIYIPLNRLSKYVDKSQLPEELGGTWVYDHDLWIQNRIQVEDFLKGAERGVSELERVRQRVSGPKQGIRLSTAEEKLSESAQVFTDTKHLAHKVLQSGKQLLDRVEKDAGISRGAMTPQDTLDTKEKVERLLEIIEGKLALLQEAWEDVQKRIVDAKEVDALEDGVRRVTDWILGSGEMLLNAQHEVGYDVTSAEDLRSDHEAVELQCRETYGHYAELLHKIDLLGQNGVQLQEDLKSQRDFMDFVCRSFATRLERRRNVLITSARFFRLVSEYFQMTSDVYESLVMCNKVESLDSAHCTLIQLQESQIDIDAIETALVREGEKLSDLLSMPVKDALGRELEVCYEGDIVNVREILDMTTARRQLFRDSVEMQRLTLQQATYIHDYELDATQAVQWLDDLYRVMLTTHSHVGCNVFEIQMQKEEHQSFQDTAKGTFEYGCQLVNAALSLRQSCKLPLEGNVALSVNLRQAWTRLNTAGQEQMTRLRVSAVFHRTVHQHCKQLKEMMTSVTAIDVEEDAARRRSKTRKLFSSRERLLVEVGRMVRLGRLLRTRLREPLSQEHCDMAKRGDIDSDMNGLAIEAVSNKLAEVTNLAEQLDRALCGSESLSTTTTGSTNISKLTLDENADWYASVLEKSSEVVSKPGASSSGGSSSVQCGAQPQSAGGHEDGSKSEEEFITASECTCTPPSRSSSFHTASEGEVTSPWWEGEGDGEGEQEAGEEIKHQTADGSPEEVVTSVVENVVVTETHYLTLSHKTEDVPLPASMTERNIHREVAAITAEKSDEISADGEVNLSCDDALLQDGSALGGAESCAKNELEIKKEGEADINDNIVHDLKEVGQGDIFNYSQQHITRHAMAGVF